eukprot:6476337-Amphidinium_carterae.2
MPYSRPTPRPGKAPLPCIQITHAGTPIPTPTHKISSVEELANGHKLFEMCYPGLQQLHGKIEEGSGMHFMKKRSRDMPSSQHSNKY